MKEIYLEKQKTLERARSILKKEFIGIDRIIDEVIDNVSSWYFLSDIQEKPAIINLWGLTGVGKTSLVNRLVELIGYEDYYFRFDVGEKEGSLSFRDSLEDLCDNKDTTPVIIALDEIQNSRTVSGQFRQEIQNDKNRMIWELIDSGKIQYIEWKRGLWTFEAMIIKLSHLLKAGVEVNRGVVTKNVNLYCREMNISHKKGERVLFVQESEYPNIISFSPKRMKLNLLKDVNEILLSFSGKDTIKFLNKVLRNGKRPTVKNFTKALIFILGNLDEAYTMSNNFSADIDADEFNRLSKRITVPHIKKALQSRFRNEQIARLGNIHIIYPALDKKSYKKIIQNELDKFADGLKNKFMIEVEFHKSINDVIYNEGVYPAQGVRPIFTSIHQILKSKMSLFITELFIKSLDIDKLYFTISNNNLQCSYLKNNKSVYNKEVKIITSLEDVRKNRKDDMQAITEVHESGHTVLSVMLLKTIPEVVRSITSDSDNQGFTYSNIAWKYVSRKEIIPRVAIILGGYIAEELIFGKDNLTSGAESDILKATEFLSNMFKYNGMDGTPITYSIPTKENNVVYHDYKEVEDKIRKAIEEAKKLAEETLKTQMDFLLELSDYLSDNIMIRKNKIRRILESKATEKVNIIENGEHLFYRKHLKQQIKNKEPFKPVKFRFNNTLSLNKKNP